MMAAPFGASEVQRLDGLALRWRSRLAGEDIDPTEIDVEAAIAEEECPAIR